MLAGWRAKVEALKREVTALAIAARDPRTPIAVKLFALAIVAYAVSPIDLIPDFVPVLGLLDELVLLPAALVVAIRLIPPEVMTEARGRADEQRLAPSRRAAAVIVTLWIAALLACLYLAWPYLPQWTA